MNPTLQTAFSAADSALFLNTPAEVARALKAWRKAGVLGLDTEFVRERTYYADLGLVQISDGNTVWLVDPLVPGCLEPVKAILEDTAVTKLLHSPSEDLEIFRHQLGVLPESMVDTQVACALLGQPLQLAYHAAANWLLDVEVAKDQTRSNWLRRPLSSAQLRYAALDVCLLPEMWRRLRQKLEERERDSWLTEDCERQIEVARAVAPDDRAWQRIRGVGRLDGVGLAIIQHLACWRETEARQRNLPRGFVVPDMALLKIAQRKVTNEAELDKLDELHRKPRERYGVQICSRVSEVLESGERLPEIGPLDGDERRALNQLRETVQHQAKTLDLDPALLASRRELEVAVRAKTSEWPDKFDGWRSQFIGEQLQRWAA